MNKATLLMNPRRGTGGKPTVLGYVGAFAIVVNSVVATPNVSFFSSNFTRRKTKDGRGRFVGVRDLDLEKNEVNGGSDQYQALCSNLSFAQTYLPIWEMYVNYPVLCIKSDMREGFFRSTNYLSVLPPPTTALVPAPFPW